MRYRYKWGFYIRFFSKQLFLYILELKDFNWLIQKLCVLWCTVYFTYLWTFSALRGLLQPWNNSCKGVPSERNPAGFGTKSVPYWLSICKLIEEVLISGKHFNSGILNIFFSDYDSELCRCKITYLIIGIITHFVFPNKIATESIMHGYICFLLENLICNPKVFCQKTVIPYIYVYMYIHLHYTDKYTVR